MKSLVILATVVFGALPSATGCGDRHGGDSTGIDARAGDDGRADGPLIDPPGAGVLLYVGNGGGGWDIYEDKLATLYQDIGATVMTATTVPSDLADGFGLLIVLSPTTGFPDPTPARTLLGRGGTVVVVTEHSGYGDHTGASAYLASLDSSMSSLGNVESGTVPLTIAALPGVTDGVASLELFYAANIALGAHGVALGTRADGAPGIGYERVGNGQVLLVPDGSFFGYALDWADNRRFLTNLAP